MRRRAAVIVLGMFLACSPSAPAADAPGLRGTVVDESGGVMALASVTVVSTDGTVNLTTTTTDQGMFEFRADRRKSYDVIVSRAGFGTSVTRVDGWPLSLTLTLKPEAVHESVTVTAERDSFRGTESMSATKMPLPLQDLPQSVGIVNSVVLQSQQIVRIGDAAHDVSGVERDASPLGDEGNVVTIRGITLDPFNNYYRDGFRYEGDAPVEIADVEQVEILKGPASIIYGGSEPGGVVNLVTKRPVHELTGSVTLVADRFLDYRPQVDVSIPLSTRLFFRLNALYGHSDGFRDFNHSTREFFAPQLEWDATDRTTVTLEGEYLHDASVTDYGIPAVGNRPASIPIRTFLGEPWNEADFHGQRIGADVTHRIGDNWNLRNGFRAAWHTWDYSDVYPVGLKPDNRTLERQIETVGFPSQSYDNQTDLTGTFLTGRIRHTLLIGFEGDVQLIQEEGTLQDYTPVDILAPIYGPQPPASVFSPTAAGYFDVQVRENFTAFGAYIQDQIGIGQRVAVSVGARVEDSRRSYADRTLGTDTSNRDVATSPRAGVVFHPTDRLSLFATFSTSFSPTVATNLNATGKPFEPERGRQLEGGVKSALLSGRLALTAAAYTVTVTNVLTLDPSNPLFSVQSGQQRSAGLEFDVAGKITPFWNILANYTFNQAEVVRDTTFAVGNLLANAPRHGANLWTVYRLEGALEGLSVGAGVTARGERAGELTNSYFLPAYARADASVAYAFGAETHAAKRYTLQLNLLNITNTRYYEAGRTIAIVYPGAPFNAVASVRVRF
jgi:iron complex outermembrane receptor protein